MIETRPLAEYSDPRLDSKIGKVRTALIYLLDQHCRDGALPTSVRFLFYELVMQRIVAKEGDRPFASYRQQNSFDLSGQHDVLLMRECYVYNLTIAG